MDPHIPLDGGELSASCLSRRYALDRALGGRQSQSSRGGENKKSLYFPCREVNSGPTAHSLVTVTD
jgi:hypothetical protein